MLSAHVVVLVRFLGSLNRVFQTKKEKKMTQIFIDSEMKGALPDTVVFCLLPHIIKTNDLPGGLCFNHALYRVEAFPIRTNRGFKSSDFVWRPIIFWVHTTERTHQGPQRALVVYSNKLGLHWAALFI
mmetsp:Transcript_19506/g.34777  ORF Transcript_19506/g.34777 Transcript_19506/m.34777 type:complete len:128 (+) Transcript_19506:224-607(+)